MNRIEEIISKQNDYMSKQEELNLIQIKENQQLYRIMKEEYLKYVLLVLKKYKVPKQYLGYYYLIASLIYISNSYEKTNTIPSLTESAKFIVSIQSKQITYKSVLANISKFVKNFIRNDSIKKVILELVNEVLALKGV